MVAVTFCDILRNCLEATKHSNDDSTKTDWDLILVSLSSWVQSIDEVKYILINPDLHPKTVTIKVLYLISICTSYTEQFTLNEHCILYVYKVLKSRGYNNVVLLCSGRRVKKLFSRVGTEKITSGFWSPHKRK
jgi:hypothetical protein